MVSRRDLVEAEAFERRRVVRAFVSGHVRPGDSAGPSSVRAIGAGMALAVLLVVGATALRLVGLS